MIPKWKSTVIMYFSIVVFMFGILIVAGFLANNARHWEYRTKSEGGTNPKYQCCPCGIWGKVSGNKPNMHKVGGVWVCDNEERCDLNRGKRGWK